MARNHDEPDVVLNSQGAASWPPLASLLLAGQIQWVIDANGEQAAPIRRVFHINLSTGLIKAYRETDGGDVLMVDRKPVIDVIQAQGPLSLQMISGELLSEYRIRQAYDGLLNGLDTFCGMLQLSLETACEKLQRCINDGSRKDLQRLVAALQQLQK